MRRTWRPERAVDIADALGELLDHMEHELEHTPIAVPARLLPYTTGLVSLDRVCDGGLRPGTLTVLDCPLASHARSLLFSAARHTDVPTLLAVGCLKEGTRWLLAGAANIPAELIRTLHLSKDDWNAINASLSGLAQRDLTVTEAPSIAGIGHLLEQQRPAILIVEEPDRFGPVSEVATSLVHLARSTGVAMLTAVASLPDLEPWIMDDLVRVTVVPHTLGGRATLITTGCSDGLAAAQVEIAMLVGGAS